MTTVSVRTRRRTLLRRGGIPAAIAAALAVGVPAVASAADSVVPPTVKSSANGPKVTLSVTNPNPSTGGATCIAALVGPQIDGRDVWTWPTGEAVVAGGFATPPQQTKKYDVTVPAAGKYEVVGVCMNPADAESNAVTDPMPLVVTDEPAAGSGSSGSADFDLGKLLKAIFSRFGSS